MIEARERAATRIEEIEMRVAQGYTLSNYERWRKDIPYLLAQLRERDETIAVALAWAKTRRIAKHLDDLIRILEGGKQDGR